MDNTHQDIHPHFAYTTW